MIGFINTAKINKEASKIAKKLDIDNRVDKYIESNAFITLKDHKPEFMSRLPCRLINPAKSNLGKVSKVILENMVRQIRTKTGSNQWKNSQDVIEWFSDLKDKKSLVFFKFDINSFYPSISETLFNEAINWSVNLCQTTAEKLEIIKNARKSFLFHENEPWVKKNGSSSNGCLRRR